MRNGYPALPEGLSFKGATAIEGFLMEIEGSGSASIVELAQKQL